MPDSRTGLERISALEARMRDVEQHMTDLSRDIQTAGLPAMQDKLDDVISSVRTIESLLLQGHGAVKLARWLAGFIVLAAFGWLGHAKAEDWLRWFSGVK